ncbi:GNAT family N-acetyltransferase [Salinifilum aidingensis]
MRAAAVRQAAVEESAVVARLLHDFNTEFDAPTPGVEVLTARLRRLLAGEATTALLAGDPAVALALLTRRPNVWFAGPVALLDELYVVPHLRGRGIGSALVERILADAVAEGVGLVEINVDEGDVAARRFYERHGFRTTEPGSDERALYYWRVLDG